jgi:hypothetical protein
VISAGIDWSSEDPDDSPPGATTEMLARAYETWLELQRELASLSAAGTHLIAEDSGHYIHHDQPDLVVDVIRGMVHSAQN